MDLMFRNIEGFEYIATNVEGAEVSDDIIISNIAMEMLTNQLNKSIKKMLVDGNIFFIRFCVTSIDNKAKHYSIKIDNTVNDFDRIFEFKKIKIVIDIKSLFYFMGIIIDYVKDGEAEGFIFFDISDPKVIDYYKDK